MKKAIIFSLIILLNLSLFLAISINTVLAEDNLGQALELQKNSQREKLNYISGEVLIKYKNNKINLQTVSGRTAALNFINSKSLEKKEDLRKNNISVLRIKDSKTVEEKIAELKNNPSVEYVEPNYKRYSAVINTNDTNKAFLWGLDNTGQNVNGFFGAIDADIDAPEAWNINEGANASIIVAVIDEGVAYNHPDLFFNMWDGSNCLNENGAYLGGCNYGYDFEDNDVTPLPISSSHGTHIAGIIAAVKNNNKGIVGVAPNARIMAIKFGLDIVSEIKAIDFAIHNGAKIINASYGGPEYSQAEYDAINRFKQAGGIFVAAAGNESSNNESSHKYPSDHNLDNIISVAATDQNDNLAFFSDYGEISVDVGAPGTNIYSTVGDEQYDYMNGTSMAAPYVAGLAALIEGYNPNLTSVQVKNAILTTGDSLASLSGKTTTGKRINAQRALQSINPAKVIVAFTVPGQVGTTTINEVAHTIAVTVPYGTAVTALIPIIAITGASVSPASGVANDFSAPVTYTVTAADGSTQDYTVIVTVDTNPDTALVAADKAALVDDSIKGANPDLSNITISLTNPLPTLGANGSIITWVSNTPDIVSSDGQTVNRPTFASGNATVTITATIARGVVTDTKVFALTVIKLPASAITTITSDTYTVSAGGTSSETIINIPFGTSKTDFLAALNKSEANQTWDNTGISNPVATGDVLAVTAQDGITKVAYVVMVNIDPDTALVSADKAALTNNSIGGANLDLLNITVSLNSLPALGVNGTTITWVSNNQDIISNDGQFVNRPAFANGDATVTMTATLTKGAVTDTKVFTLIVIKLPASTTAIITSEIYAVSASGTITNIPFGTDKTAFLAALTKGQNNQTWNTTGIADPVVTGNALVVTAQDGTTTVTYMITILPNPVKKITSFTFSSPEVTGVVNETTHKIAVAVPYGTVVTALAPTIEITGASVNPVSGVAQNFTNPVIYTVTAADSSTQAYAVTVTVNVNSSGGGGGGGGGISAPVDTTPPDKPSQFMATRKKGLIKLAWVNPTSSDFNKVIIIKDIKSISNSILGKNLRNYGTVVYEGNLKTYEDKNISDNIVYYYAISSYDNSGNYSQPIIFIVPSIVINESEEPVVEVKPEVLGIKVVDYSSFTTLFGVSSDLVNSVSQSESGIITSQQIMPQLTSINANIFSKIFSSYLAKMSDLKKNSAAYFIQIGTPTTKRLGSGERGSALNSYLAAFNTVPSSTAEWQDVIKIANGRWPSQQNAAAVARATVLFKKVYLRAPDSKNSYDSNAVTIIAYGLRPASRNLNSEKIAIKSFKAIFKYNPGSAVDWNVVMAIAYSGAKR